MDKHSNYLVKNLKSYVQDSPDLLRIIQEENDSGPQNKSTIPVTIDVSALYTSIPAKGDNGGIKAFENALNRRSDEAKSKMPTSFLLDRQQEPASSLVYLLKMKRFPGLPQVVLTLKTFHWKG